MMMEKFLHYYSDLLGVLLDSATPSVKNERTGVMVKVLGSGCSFVLDLSDGILPTMGLRKAYPYVAGAELAWFLSGEKDITWLNKYAPRIWSKFTEEGTTEVANAYGYRWRTHFYRDQIALAVKALQSNPSDRRVYIAAWDPGLDGLGRTSKNVPCPVGFSVYVLGARVHMSVFLRSLDVFVGLPYDVMDFSLLLKAFADELDLNPGTLRTTAAHAHLYEPHWEMAEMCLTQTPVVPQFEMPSLKVLRIPVYKDEYVEQLKAEAAKYQWPKYNPRPEVVE